jgi:uncharacterized protein (DUF302 family)
MLFGTETKKEIQQVVIDLKVAAQRHAFGVMAVHDLKAKMQEKGVAFDRDCIVMEVCNPQQAKKVLEASPEVSTALPCRIAVYKSPGGCTIATLRPTQLLEMFNTPGLRYVAKEVEETLLKIIGEAAK